MESEPLATSCLVRGQVLSITLRGAVTHEAAAVLQHCMRTLQRQFQPVVVLDLSGLQFIASAGLGALVAMRELVRVRGGELRLAAPTPAVLEILTITGLGRLFPLYGDITQAEA